MTPGDYERLCGWNDMPDETERIMGMQPFPIFGLANEAVAESGKGKVVLLHKYIEEVRGSHLILAQTIGDCVSQGWAKAVLILICVQIALKKQREKFPGDPATEPIYAGSRVETGGGRIGRADGSNGSWAADWVTKFGVVFRQKYGSIDLTTYDGNRARAWGMPRAGCPDELEPIAKEHPVKTVSLCTSYDQARDAIANGYPVPVASNRGFQMRRDEKGFARPSGSWPHQMCFVAVDDADGRPGLLCDNSWGPDWISGPKRHDQPEGSFWVDADVATTMLRQGDSHVASNFEGFPSQDLDTTQW